MLDHLLTVEAVGGTREPFLGLRVTTGWTTRLQASRLPDGVTGVSNAETTFSSDSLLVVVEVLGSVRDRTDGADPLSATANDIDWGVVALSPQTRAPRRV